MPAKSKAQRRFMGMVTAMKHGSLNTDKLPKGVAEKVKKAAKSMSTKSAEDFAKTKEKKLPNRVKENAGEMTFKQFLIEHHEDK